MSTRNDIVACFSPYGSIADSNKSCNIWEWSNRTVMQTFREEEYERESLGKSPFRVSEHFAKWISVTSTA